MSAHKVSYQVLLLPVAAGLFVSELVNAEKKELKGKRHKKREGKKREDDTFMLFSGRCIAGMIYVLANGLDIGFVSFTGNLLVA